MIKKILSIVLWIVAIANLSAQNSQMTPSEYNRVKCQELAEEERREEELYRAKKAEIERKRAQLNSDQIEIQVQLYNKQLAQLDFELAQEKAELDKEVAQKKAALELKYAKQKAEIAAKMTAHVNIIKNNCFK